MILINLNNFMLKKYELINYLVKKLCLFCYINYKILFKKSHLFLIFIIWLLYFKVKINMIRK